MKKKLRESVETLTKSYKYKAKCNFVTNKNALECLELSRLLYNSLLEERIIYYNMHKHLRGTDAKYSLTVYDQKKELPELKEYDKRFKKYPSNIFQDVCFKLNQTYENFFRTNGFPKFKRKHEFNSINMSYAGGYFIDGFSSKKLHNLPIIPE